MATKKIILLLIVLSLLMSGCLSLEDGEENEEDQGAGGGSGGSQRPREMRTPEGLQGEMWTPEETGSEGEVWISEETGVEGEMWTPGESGSQEETVAQEEFETPAETETQGELGISEETGTSEVWEEPETGTGEGERPDAAQPNGTAPATHLVRLKDYLMIPSRLQINTGDTVVWRNYQESSALVLTSKEYLFEDQRLVYGNTLEYTFTEPGSYNFSVKGYPKMQMTITVK